MLRAARRTSPLPPQVAQVGRAWCPAWRPLPLARRAALERLELDRLLDPGGDLGQRELHRHPHVLAPPRVGRAAPAAEERLEAAQPAEVAHEDVERLGQVHVVEPEARPRRPTPALP